MSQIVSCSIFYSLPEQRYLKGTAKVDPGLRFCLKNRVRFYCKIILQTGYRSKYTIQSIEDLPKSSRTKIFRKCLVFLYLNFTTQKLFTRHFMVTCKNLQNCYALKNNITHPENVNVLFCRFVNLCTHVVNAVFHFGSFFIIFEKK